MKKHFPKAFASSIMAAAMLTSVTAAYAPINASAELLAETTFDSKILPWQTVESAPASQEFELKDGAVHITINESEGSDGEKWDLQFRYRNLSFKKSINSLLFKSFIKFFVYFFVFFSTIKITYERSYTHDISNIY